MNIYLLILAVLIALYFYANRNRKQKQAYFRDVMNALQEKGISSDQLLKSLSPTESGKILVGCYKRKETPEKAADILLNEYNKFI